MEFNSKLVIKRTIVIFEHDTFNEVRSLIAGPGPIVWSECVTRPVREPVPRARTVRTGDTAGFESNICQCRFRVQLLHSGERQSLQDMFVVPVFLPPRKPRCKHAQVRTQVRRKRETWRWVSATTFTQNESPVIIYSPSFSVKPVWLSVSTLGGIHCVRQTNSRSHHLG